MKYFSEPIIPSIPASINSLTDYCINLEIGKECFKNGNIINPVFSELKIFPEFYLEGVHIFIKPIFAFIVVPEDSVEELIRILEINLQKKSQKFRETYGFNHLTDHTGLETFRTQYTLLKAKTNYKNYSIRKFYSLETGNFEKKIQNIRFNWFVLSHKNFIGDLNKTDNRLISEQLQLLTIYYDPENNLKLNPESVLLEKLTYEYFKVCSGILNLTYMGEIYKIKSLEFEKTNFRIYFSCSDRTSFELIRKLGNSLVYNNVITEKNYIDSIISSRTALTSRCKVCNTPHYDWVYIIEKTGMEVCGICIERKFIMETSLLHKYSDSGNLLYNEGDKILKISFPVKKQDLIMNIPETNLRLILTEMEKKNILVDRYKNYSAIYLDFDPKNLKDKNYILWTGSVYDFIIYTLFIFNQKILGHFKGNINKTRKFIENSHIILVQEII